MNDADQTSPRRAEHHPHAQTQAYRWATRAEAEYETATEHEDKARRFAGKAYLAEPMADERRLAQFHGVRSTEALKLAEMWARVARALADVYLPEPVLLTGATTGVDDGL
ncbi:MAG: hypothetical protein HOV92_37060 [Streptomyces sp.]|nr:hypothetical protein [Streptomyces sp.]